MVFARAGNGPVRYSNRPVRSNGLSSAELRGGSIWVLATLLLVLCCAPLRGYSMTDAQIAALRQETVDVFFHGYDNYMKYAFPEDELRPLSCGPLTRDRENPGHVALNDALGNYSLTLVDSLSTLAIFASSTTDENGESRGLQRFQEGVKLFVELYGDGTDGPGGQGTRSHGFDIDSKVQVFETVIRGLGGLLSAHLFAVGELPIRGYNPQFQPNGTDSGSGEDGIAWPNGFKYNGQLLRLAHDLGKRLLPAFRTPTGMPYPRVNLRHGIPFYANSPLNNDPENGQCERNGGRTETTPVEITETCSAGAGSLVLEFTTLSRLTEDDRFEKLGKKAFWSVVNRRSAVGLVGAGIDAESGLWIGPYTGIGAGIDSLFEYAFKSHILLSGTDTGNAFLTETPSIDPRSNISMQLSGDEDTHSADAFLKAWEDAHFAIKRHLYRGPSYHHPHYIQADLNTGALRAFWIDSLSAYYPGLLTLGGELEEAIETHLLYTALWTRFSALPERWSTMTGDVEGGLGWWGGRPEFIESTWYLYRATQDPWYLHVGEMALRDIKRRCWTKCGWAGLEDVRTGEKQDRMESFFLGETTKYLFLLFDPTHPLNKIDAPFVFSTEGHPLILPRQTRNLREKGTVTKRRHDDSLPEETNEAVCPVPSSHIPLSISATAARGDLFHAASLARLHLRPNSSITESPLVEFSASQPSISLADLQSPTNYTFFPWTLPSDLIPHNGTCSKMATRLTFDISFPTLPNTFPGSATLQRVREGILLHSMSGTKLSMIKEDMLTATDEGEVASKDTYRVSAVSHIILGRDERVFVPRDLVTNFNPLDPNFTRIRDAVWLDLVIDAEPPETEDHLESPVILEDDGEIASLIEPTLVLAQSPDSMQDTPSSMRLVFSSLLQHVSSMLSEPSTGSTNPELRETIPAIMPSGIGAAPLPEVEDAPGLDAPGLSLPWHKIYVGDDTCRGRLPMQVSRDYQIIVIKRGGCSFNEKLRNIPSYPPSASSLQLVVIVSFAENDRESVSPGEEESLPEGVFVRPLLDQVQYTKGGIPRRHPIPMIMVGGGDKTYQMLQHAKAVGFRRRYSVTSQGLPISNLIIL
ncbi:glycoside hydrolase family 47 protein [Xylona heveae TC161]|uniref:alpha-1,2-Mannosidase n=1 Tax=Xylona heveae (strain CBS 132557 / TC161) TaxID=1328760 RepID=A0A165I739_XYLHT|nr:glycoside hydrolase family 47 protein [Xylona heveae TC161]KZF24485.1 glycoside hydrolase family 47 protein [Xylona heveae TC161]